MYLSEGREGGSDWGSNIINFSVVARKSSSHSCTRLTCVIVLYLRLWRVFMQISSSSIQSPERPSYLSILLFSRMLGHRCKWSRHIHRRVCVGLCRFVYVCRCVFVCVPRACLCVVNNHQLFYHYGSISKPCNNSNLSVSEFSKRQCNIIIHYGELCSASSRLLLRSAPDPCTAIKESFEAREECVRLTELYCIALYSSIYITPFNSHGQT